MQYSTQNEIENHKQNLGKNPMYVLDMDGNVLIGYVLPEDVKVNPNSEIKNPDNQSIPFSMSVQELDYHVKQGFLKKETFAAKSMDVRLPPYLVKAINEFNDRGEPFRLTLLTSRSMDEALKILELSGVKEPSKVTLVADSGGTLQIEGNYENARPLYKDEITFFDSIDGVIQSPDFQHKLQEAVQATGLNPSGMPDLYIEPKGIAKNIHYRNILKHFDEPEGSDLDDKLTHLLQTTLGEMVKEGPKEGSDSAFKLLDGPATVEVKIANINKGHGLEVIADRAMKSATPPSAVIFSGDDVSKMANGKAGPGTDYYAMITAKKLEVVHGVPFFNMHTHHPDQDGQPDAAKLPSNLSPNYEVPQIDIVIPTPADNGTLIAGVLGFASKEKGPQIVVSQFGGGYDVQLTQD